MRDGSRNSDTCGLKLFATIVHGFKIWIWIVDVTELVNRPVYLILMLSSFSTLNHLSYRADFKIIKITYPFKIYYKHSFTLIALLINLLMF